MILIITHFITYLYLNLPNKMNFGGFLIKSEQKNLSEINLAKIGVFSFRSRKIRFSY